MPTHCGACLMMPMWHRTETCPPNTSRDRSSGMQAQKGVKPLGHNWPVLANPLACSTLRMRHVPACSTAPDHRAGKECSAGLHSHATSGAHGRAAPGCHLCPRPSLPGLQRHLSRTCGCKRSWCSTVRRGRGFGLSGGASSHPWGRPTARAAEGPEARATLNAIGLLPSRRPPQVQQSCTLRLACSCPIPVN